MDFSPLSCLHKTSEHTPQEIKSSQMIVGLLLAHLEQTDCKEISKKDLDVCQRESDWHRESISNAEATRAREEENSNRRLN